MHILSPAYWLKLYENIIKSQNSMLRWIILFKVYFPKLQHCLKMIMHTYEYFVSTAIFTHMAYSRKFQMCVYVLHPCIWENKCLNVQKRQSF